MDAYEELAARVAQLEDERAVLETLYRYAHAIDYGDFDAWADCFAEDAVFDVRFGGDARYVVTGRADLREFVGRHTHAPDAWHKHLLIEPLVSVAGDTATATSYLAVVQDGDGVPVLRLFGRYRDRLARGADGRWRFTERLAEVESARRDLPPLVARPQADREA